MLPTSVHIMLTLPFNWELMTSGSVTARLYQGLPRLKLQIEFARHLVASVFDATKAACLARSGHNLRCKPIADLKWQIGDVTFLYVPIVNDASFWDCFNLGPSNCIIVPPAHDALMRGALANALDGKAPDVLSLAGFVDLRLLFASAELKMSREQIVRWVLKRYNRRVRKCPHAHRLVVDFPQYRDG